MSSERAWICFPLDKKRKLSSLAFTFKQSRWREIAFKLPMLYLCFENKNTESCLKTLGVTLCTPLCSVTRISDSSTQDLTIRIKSCVWVVSPLRSKLNCWVLIYRNQRECPSYMCVEFHKLYELGVFHLMKYHFSSKHNCFPSRTLVDSVFRHYDV